LVLVLGLLLSGNAFAQGGEPRDSDDERARVLYQNGAILYEEGRYEDAIRAWEEAHRLSKRPLFLFNIANALERIGRWQEALEYLNRYRAFAPAEERTVLERRMRNIERRLDESRARDAETADRQAEEAARKEAELEAAQARAEEVARIEREAAQVAPEASAGGTLIPGVALFATGTGLLGLGGALSGLATTARTEAAAECKESAGLLLCPRSATAALERDEAFSRGGDIALAAGAGIAATGLVLVIVHVASGGKPVARGPVQLSPTAGPTGLGFGLHGSFR
jgi:tetratricopeptide (TPR) repeat protein